ncbi:MAG: helix-turn-helix transcriptional regulator [Christensenellales bacterium]|jgi:predicted DNA-binding transcriptional regulator YafY
MKVDRLLGILTLLLQRGRMTAPELAARFEVSRRTISRDVETLCQAGIPLVTTQGAGGGIAIAPGYRIDPRLLTREELSALVSGLMGVESILQHPVAPGILDKLQAPEDAGRMSISLAAHDPAGLAAKIALLRRAQQERQVAAFTYYSPKGATQRTLEVEALAYEYGDWYVTGYCHLRRDFRRFKLRRMAQLSLTGQGFAPRPGGAGALADYFVANYQVLARFAPETQYRLVEEYGPDGCQRQADGALLLRQSFTDWNNMLSWFLSFGAQVEVLEPEPLRRALAEHAQKMCALYGET